MYTTFVDSSGKLSTSGAQDRALLAFDDDFSSTSSKRDLLAETVSESSSCFSLVSCVSLTRVNQLINTPEKEDLNRLMKDQVFVDYFNVFLNLPVSMFCCLLGCCDLE